MISYQLSKIGKNKKERCHLLLGVSTLLVIISSVLMFMLFNPTGDPSRIYYGLDTRAFSLLIGAILAIFTHYYHRFKLSNIASNIIGIVSLLITCYMVGNIAGYDEVLYKGGYLIASILSAFLILSILKETSIMSRILSLPVINWLGKLSYSIYLWHYPIIILISGGKKSSVLIMIIEVILTLVMAVLSYYVIETPIRRGVISKSYHAIRNHSIQRLPNLKLNLQLY